MQIMTSRFLFSVFFVLGLIIFSSQAEFSIGSETSVDGRHIPVIDISMLMMHSSYDSTPTAATTTSDALLENAEDALCRATQLSSEAINHASRTSGFFYIKNHGVSDELIGRMLNLSAAFFALPLEEKQTISMMYGGKAWRGFFAVGDEMTSGAPDEKEGIYYGTELTDETDPSYSLPLHGRNQWLDSPLGRDMQETVLLYMSQMKVIGQKLMHAIACNLLDSSSTEQRAYKQQLLDKFNHPTELFRVFNYPPHDARFGERSMGVGEHTDYGYLTILYQDRSGGLQVRDLENKWVDAPFVPGTFVVNLGDALQHSTQGLYRATPHRVVQRANAVKSRLSMPYFFDPDFQSDMLSMVPFMSHENREAVAARHRQQEQQESESGSHINSNTNANSRWDKADPALFKGRYGDYLMSKVSKVFPVLFQQQELDTLLRDSAQARDTGGNIAGIKGNMY